MLGSSAVAGWRSVRRATGAILESCGVSNRRWADDGDQRGKSVGCLWQSRSKRVHGSGYLQHRSVSIQEHALADKRDNEGAVRRRVLQRLQPYELHGTKQQFERSRIVWTL